MDESSLAGLDFSSVPGFANLFFVPTSVKERVQKLREEIEAMSEANRTHTVAAG